MKIDDPDHYVCQEVWDLYQYAIKKIGPTHTLLEWDAKIPELHILIQEAEKALIYMHHSQELYAHR